MSESAPPNEANQSDTSDSGLSDEELAGYAQRLEYLPLDEAVWVARLIQECRRARSVPLTVNADGEKANANVPESDVAQIVLDAAEWLKTLWEVGYMGAGHLAAAPRSEFPAIELEDVLNSALLARIRHGRRPLPFPPPTRQGMPWHEVVESTEEFIVEASLIEDDGRPIGAMIEGCADWRVCAIGASDDYVVQHQGKGPRYRLHHDPLLSTLQRLPPVWSRRIILQERRGIRSFALEWPKEDGKTALVSLRAATWERAESEASHWVAIKHPEMYGQIAFERCETVA